MNDIWLIGCNGMLGQELSLVFDSKKLTYSKTDREVDITDPLSIENYCKNKNFKWIINCAAYTAVDKAQDNPDKCRKLNVLGAANVASLAKKLGAILIHISTDYVFNKKEKTPCLEDDTTNPSCVYGVSKLYGEIAVLENNPETFIIRTAWLFGKYGSNFVSTMLKLMNERNEINVVNDQYGSPTWTYSLSLVILKLIETVNNKSNIPFGIYHYTNEGAISWYDFAKEIYIQAKEFGMIKNECKISSCTSSDYITKAKRPEYSVLDKSKIKATLGISIPAWENTLKEYLKSCAL
jgi:dTDP-4-dehydrorhamnose reductase